LRHLERAIPLIPQTAQRALALHRGLSPGVRSLSQAALTLWCLGAPVQAVRQSQEALALDHPYSLAAAHLWGSLLHQRRRDVVALQAQAEALVTLATGHRFPDMVGYGTWLHGWAIAMQGQWEAGLAELRQGLASILATGLGLARPACLVLFAEATGNFGQIEEALRLLAEALEALAASGRGDLLTEVYRLQGEFLLRQAPANVPQAEACFQQALAVARRQQARSWELRAAMSLSRLWQYQGKQNDARQLLTPIYGCFTEGFDTADLQEAKALLEELGA
jgi:predicted ATPase